jgi:hypothetical protein
MDESLQSQNRRHRRSNVMLKATLEAPGASLPVVLRNLSENGALVKGEELPLPGTRVLFHREGLSVPSRIAWAHCDHAGLEFDFPLFPREVLRHIPTGERKPPPELVKRPGLGARPLTQSERRLIEAWAIDTSVHDRPGL